MITMMQIHRLRGSGDLLLERNIITSITRNIITMMENHRQRLRGSKDLLPGTDIIIMIEEPRLTITKESHLLRGTTDLLMITVLEEDPQIPTKLSR